MIAAGIIGDRLMSFRHLLTAAVLAMFAPAMHAQSAAREAGKAVGQFGAGVGEAVTQPMREQVQSMQPEWITIAPRSKAECMAESGGVVNTTFMRCRNGWQEYVRHDAAGNKKVISERAIPQH